MAHGNGAAAVHQLPTSWDVVIAGSGHNGLVAAAYLAKAGKSVLVLEKAATFGGATTSAQVFPDYEAQLSRYSYLVSLFPQQIIDELGLSFEARRRAIASFTPWKDEKGRHRGLLLSNTDVQRSRSSIREMTGSESAWTDYQKLLSLESAIAKLVWPSMLQPLRHRQDFVSRLESQEEREAWKAFVEEPLGNVIERYAQHDVLRGLLMTDGKIGVLTHPHDETLLQNRCFLYHVTGNETGEWRVPVGGMKSVRDSLIQCCQQWHVRLLGNAEVLQIQPARPGQTDHAVTFRTDTKEMTVDAKFVLINAGPRAYARMMGEAWVPASSDEGSVIKINMLLRRLPRLRAAGISPEDAFCGSFHLDEGYEQMKTSFQMASSGIIPDPVPGELYCHTLTDGSILSPDLQRRGFHTLTLFGLDMPYRLFRDQHDEKRDRVLEAYLRQLDDLCEDSFRDCLAEGSDGRPCIEIRTPQELEKEIDLDLGNIFHNTLSWFFTDDVDAVGTWGVETGYPGIFRAGSSALRGGAVSGIPGRNAAMAVLSQRKA